MMKKNGRNFKIVSLMVVMVLVSSLLGCASKQETIKIATKPMTEQFILGEMLALLIEADTDLSVELTKGVGGGTSNIQPALLKGDFDLYPEYTGTGWSFVLKESGIPDDKTLYKELTKKYEDEFNLKWVSLYGFNNTYGLVVGKEIAEQYNIRTYSDLAAYSKDLIFGAEYDFFEREDGYDALTKMYGLTFKDTVDLDIGLKYKAINSKEIDVMNIFTTDGQLATSNVVVLEDDKNFYQTYYCGTVVRMDTLKKYPELEPVLMKMDNILTDREMSELNNKVETEGMDEGVLAKEFLIKKGLLTE